MLDLRRTPPSGVFAARTFRDGAVFSYGIALVFVVLATLARAALDPILGDRVPYATYYPAVTAIAFFGSLGAALLATLVSAFLGNYFFVAPPMAFSLGTTADQLALVLFLATGGMVAVLTERISRVRRQLTQALAAEARHAERVLEERSRLQALIASIPGVVWEAWTEPDSERQRIDFVSDYVTTMLGYTPEEWRSRPNFWLQLVPADEREQAARVSADKSASGQPSEGEFQWVTKDGRHIWVLARSSVIKDDDGTPLGMRGITFDISARKEVERRLALLAEISTSGLASPVFGDLASQIARRTADVLGDYCIVRMLQGDTLVSVAGAHMIEEAEAVVQMMAERPQIAAFDGDEIAERRTLRTVVDNNVTISRVAAPARDDATARLIDRYRPRRTIVCPLVSHGRLLGTLELGRASGPPYVDGDVRLLEAIASRAALALDNARLFEASQREAEEARAARGAAEEAGRVKDEFLATLSHELRTPLNAILGWAHMLRDPRLPDDRRRSAIDTIVRNAQSQEQLIADILDVQRIMAGKLRLNAGTVDLGNIVRTAAETVQPSADAKAIRLQLLLDLDVTPITGDPDRLQQVVWNLLSNAIKFAPHGGRVQVRLSKSDTHCIIIVEDNGPGINPEFMPFMFERFRQADSSTTRTHKGLGLGLAIVRSLVEMHGGSIEAANVAGSDRTGAMFTIRLPLQGARTAAGDGGDALSSEREPLWLSDAPSLEGIRVLVVEDDNDARALLSAILQRCGANVSIAASAEEGFAMLTAKRPDVLISDIEMPHEDGYMFIRRVRALGATGGGDTPAVAVTAYASATDRLKVLGAGFNMHVAKPVQPAELAMVVASLAGRNARLATAERAQGA